jgi:pyruvate/2-oxoglutarate dehydrogenase complex dihydrolipoamide dehydrogenase (E3) component
MNTESSIEAGRTQSAPLEALEPWDEHNRRLAANVHPPDWENPPARDGYHLLVVGGGTGGLVTASIAAALGAKVAMVERALLGGDCLNTGCVPSKALIEAARDWRSARKTVEPFAKVETSGDAPFQAAMARMRRVRADISHHDSAQRFTGLGVDVFLGHAAFTGPDTATVAGQTLRFRRAVIAAGTRASVPAIPGLREAGYFTNETIFSLTELPRSLTVIGGGPIGCELVQAFAGFGTRVTLVEAEDRILPKDDPDAAAVVARGLEADGVRVECGVTVQGVELRDGERIVRCERGAEILEITTDHLLIAAGRRPNVEDLGLEAAGVEFDARLGIRVDDRLRTTSSRIYAIGDIASPFQFTHAADAQARLVVRNALFFGRGRSADLVIPWCTYTTPELAHVGITFQEAADRSEEVETLTVPLAEVDRARLGGGDEGFLRVHLRAGSDTILGATLVAEHAGEIISQITQAMVAGVGLGRLGETIFPYPTRAEVIRKVADRWRRGKLTPTARRLFGVYFAARG